MCCFQRCAPNIISSVHLVLCQVYPLLRQVGFLPGCVTFKSLMCGDILNAFRLLFLSASALAVGLCWGVTVHSAILRACLLYMHVTTQERRSVSVHAKYQHPNLGLLQVCITNRSPDCAAAKYTVQVGA